MKGKVAEYTCPGATLALAQGSEGDCFSGEADGTLRRWRFSLETVGRLSLSVSKVFIVIIFDICLNVCYAKA